MWTGNVGEMPVRLWTAIAWCIQKGVIDESRTAPAHLFQTAMLAACPDCHLRGSSNGEHERRQALGADGEENLQGVQNKAPGCHRYLCDRHMRQEILEQGARPQLIVHPQLFPILKLPNHTQDTTHPAPDLSGVVGTGDVVKQEAARDDIATASGRTQVAQDQMAPADKDGVVFVAQAIEIGNGSCACAQGSHPASETATASAADATASPTTQPPLIYTPPSRPQANGLEV